MDKYFLMHRTDGTGSRLFSLVNTMWLSQKVFGDLLHAKFLWNESRFNDKGKSVADANNSSMRSFGDVTIIGASCERKESIFSQDFIKKYYLEFPNGKQERIYAYSNKKVESLKEKFLSNDVKYITNDIHFMYDIFKGIDIKSYKKELAILWNKIEFSNNLVNMQKLAQTHANNIGEFIAIHLRSADIIYTYFDARKINRQTTNHATPYEYTLGIISENRDKKIVLVGDDITALRELKRVLNNDNVILADSLRDMEKYSNLELFIYDIALMSRATTIYGTHSALVKLASVANPNIKCINPHKMPAEKLYNWLKIYHEKLSALSASQRAFSCFHLFMKGEMLNENKNILISYLQNALSYDPQNDKYRIHIANLLLLQKKYKQADDYIAKCLEERGDEFPKLLVAKYTNGAFAFAEVFGNFNSKYKNIQKIYELIKSAQNSVKHTASYRIQHELPYKIGVIMMENYNQKFAYAKICYKSLWCAFLHLFTLKESNSLPKLQTLPDYNQGLKCKNHKAYKYGLALIKAFKTFYRGGIKKLFIEIKEIKNS